MAKTFTHQASHSRNAHDWSYETTPDGRHVLVANRKGVWARLGKVFAHLNRQGGNLRAGQILSYLQRLHASYQASDLSAVKRALVKAGVITVSGRGNEALWSITAKGRAIMNTAQVKWV